MFRDKSYILRNILGRAEYRKCPCIAQTADDCQYKAYYYNGSFHKGFTHDPNDGHLSQSSNYEIMRDSILCNNQQELANLALDPNAVMKLVNPLSSLSTVLIGKPQCLLCIDVPPVLSSPEAAAEMVELYCMSLMRDAPFVNYLVNQAKMPSVLTFMNTAGVLNNLMYRAQGPVTRQNIFRGPSIYDQYGPYISQLLLLRIPYNYKTIKQKHFRFVPKIIALGQVEWGVNTTEAIQIQNANIDALPPIIELDISRGYIHSGRALAEFVHNEPPYQVFLNASLILASLGAQPNPGFPVYPNQTAFITGCGGPILQSMLGIACAEALRHVFFWKWAVYRRLRPDVMALWIDNILNGRVSNVPNYGIDDVVLTNPVLSDIEAANSFYGPGTFYTLPMTYREGAPLHPSYPAGHAAIAGACCTILKIFFNAEQSWSSLPGVQTASLTKGIVNPVIANAIGSQLIHYTGTDASLMTINTELDKLASNASFGRCWAGIHYRSDIVQGLRLGEQVAVHVMEDSLSAMVENNLNHTVPKITFRKFDNTFETIQPTICKRRCK